MAIAYIAQLEAVIAILGNRPSMLPPHCALKHTPAASIELTIMKTAYYSILSLYPSHLERMDSWFTNTSRGFIVSPAQHLISVDLVIIIIYSFLFFIIFYIMTLLFLWIVMQWYNVNIGKQRLAATPQNFTNVSFYILCDATA